MGPLCPATVPGSCHRVLLGGFPGPPHPVIPLPRGWAGAATLLVLGAAGLSPRSGHVAFAVGRPPGALFLSFSLPPFLKTAAVCRRRPPTSCLVCSSAWQVQWQFLGVELLMQWIALWWEVGSVPALVQRPIIVPGAAQEGPNVQEVGLAPSGAGVEAVHASWRQLGAEGRWGRSLRFWRVGRSQEGPHPSSCTDTKSPHQAFLLPRQALSDAPTPGTLCQALCSSLCGLEHSAPPRGLPLPPDLGKRGPWQGGPGGCWFREMPQGAGTVQREGVGGVPLGEGGSAGQSRGPGVAALAPAASNLPVFPFLPLPLFSPLLSSPL